MLSNNLKSWLEKNIDLLDEVSIDELWGKCPAELYRELYSALEAAGIDLTERNTDTMWGIKSNDGRYTLSLGKHNKTNYNVNHTSSQGMKGGMQIGFKSLVDCLMFLPEAEKRYPHIHLRPSKMQKKIVDSYVWTEVDTVYGKCYVTNLAIDKYDPVSAAKNKLRKKATSEACYEEDAWISKNVNISDIEHGLQKYSTDYTEVHLYNLWDKTKRRCVGGLYITNVACDKSSVAEVLNAIEISANMKFQCVDIEEHTSLKYGRVCYISLIPDVTEYNDIEKTVYATYGI